MEALHELTYEGYTSWIQVDDQKLQCYSADVDYAKKIVTCWIASEVGKTFSIGWRPNNSQLPRKVAVHLDGVSVKTRRMEETARGPYFVRTVCTSNTTEAPFVFSVLELTDDDNYLEATPNVGEIKIVINSTTDPVWKNCKKNCSKCAPRRYRHQIPPVEKIHERSKKAIAHRIGFGNEQLRTSKLNQNSSTKKKLVAHSDIKDHLVTFIFRYRPLDVLQANDIAPRMFMPSENNGPSTSSQSSKGKRKATDLMERAQDSVKKFEDREMALLAELDRLKGQKEQFLLAELEKLRMDKYSSNDNAPRKKVKKETKPLFLSGEVIDLT